MSVLRWLYNANIKLEMFVENRVSKILASTRASQWRFVPSEMNPADLGTKGIKADDTESWSRFHGGPEFMRLPPSEWPKMPCDLAEVNDDEFDELLRSFSNGDGEDRSISNLKEEEKRIIPRTNYAYKPLYFCFQRKKLYILHNVRCNM